MTEKTSTATEEDWADRSRDGVSLIELVSALAIRWRLIAMVTVGGVLCGFVLASLIPKWYVARTVFLPPQQQQSSAAAAISQLGALAGFAGGLVSVKSPADQYVSLMESATISNRIIDRFGLLGVYDVELREEARKELRDNVKMSVGKKDGLISVDVTDREPARAAAIANAYIEELRQLTNGLAVSEAQQRRMFFEQQLGQTKLRLAKAQTALQESGISQGALKVEPKTAAETYARLRAQVTAAEIKLQSLLRMLSENTPEVMQQHAVLAALREQLARAERQTDERGDSDYVNKYREFKYQEALFDIFVKQYELARVDESREGALIQVVDAAQPPELKAGPKRVLISSAMGFLALLGASIFVAASGMRMTDRRAREDR